MEEKTVSQCRAGNTKPPRARFPKHILDKVGSLPQWVPGCLFILFHFRKKYTKKLMGDLDMKLCQFISHADSHDLFGHQQFQGNLSDQVSA